MPRALSFLLLFSCLTAPGCVGLPFAHSEDTTLLQTPDAWVAAPWLQGPAWECRATQEPAKGQAIAMVKCSSKGPDDFFFLVAKDYTVPASSTLSAESLATNVFARQYRQMFRDVQFTRSAAITHSGHPGWENAFDAVSESRGSIRKLERVLVSGNHVLILSAEGNPEDVSSHQAETALWFMDSRFANL